MKMLSVKSRAIVFLPFNTFAYFASLRLETSFNLSFDLPQDGDLTEPFGICYLGFMLVSL